MEELIMPHIDVKMFPGRSNEIKKNLAEKLRETAAKELGVDEAVLSVSIEDVEKDTWNKDVADSIPEEEILAGEMYRVEE